MHITKDTSRKKIYKQAESVENALYGHREEGFSLLKKTGQIDTMKRR